MHECLVVSSFLWPHGAWWDFSRQEYWSGLPFSIPGNLSSPGIEPMSPALAVLSCSVVSDSFWPGGLQPTRLLCPWGFSRQEYWSELPCPPPGDLLHPGIEPMSLKSPALEGRFFTANTTWELPFRLLAACHRNLACRHSLFFSMWLFTSSPWFSSYCSLANLYS